MTIKQARRVLGKLGKGLSDKDLEKELEFTRFLAELVFDSYRQEMTQKNNYNGRC